MTASPKSPNRWSLSIGDLTQAAVFAALIAALGLPGTINIGTSGVPITFQSLGVILAGAVLGPRKGTLAVVIFMVLAIAGLPILSGGRNGLTALSSPTAGYFIGFLPAVIVIGVLTALMVSTGGKTGSGKYRVLWGIGINALGGIVVLYACGVLGLLVRTDLTLWAAIATNGSFIPGDIAKCVIAALVAAQVHRGRPGLIEPLRARRSGTVAG
ncbi:biotin transporter BioY [Gordonia hongkongensis]|uniref:Biotin transporter n=1 Tax=Gordonia hongkongensis TaxID=1701090 RepID=A0AAX3TBB9_9ACTN|nr:MULTISPECIES: biotin transporter BioY [Gordonia]OCW85322.1 biotin biosynthesis protein BioY [Nocardia farcinica]QIK48720.1 biotin transporter BioY [Gordonia terrae]KSU59756.1 biotin biosynthesis protein BioY [Gordonia sp. SGD-V-85]MBN0971391.1 biotin transporter BioY [Gordonia sp. BP-119]MBN0982236.1 biotin transporter BioY [Gordonia sp. BP-94]